MNKYLLFIIVGILLFLFINIEAFSIGGQSEERELICCIENDDTCTTDNDCSGRRICTSNSCEGYSRCNESDQIINCHEEPDGAGSSASDEPAPDPEIPLIDTKIDGLNYLIYNDGTAIISNIIFTIFVAVNFLVMCQERPIEMGNIYYTNFLSSQLAKGVAYVGVGISSLALEFNPYDTNYALGALPLIASELIIFLNIMMSGAMNIYKTTLSELNRVGTLTTLSSDFSCTNNIRITGNFVEDAKRNILYASFSMFQENLEEITDNFDEKFGVMGIFNSIDMSAFSSTGERLDMNTITHIMQYMDLWDTIYSYHGLDSSANQLADFNRNIEEFFPLDIDRAKIVLQQQFRYTEEVINEALYETITIEHPIMYDTDIQGHDYTTTSINIRTNWRDIAIEMAQRNKDRVQPVNIDEIIDFSEWILTLGKLTTQYFLRGSVNNDAVNDLFDPSISGNQIILLDFTKVTYNGWFEPVNNLFDFYISLVNRASHHSAKRNQITILPDATRMRTTYPLSKTLGVCAALTKYSGNYVFNKFLDVTKESVGCIVTTVGTLLQDGYNQLYTGSTENTDLMEVLIQAPATMRVGTRRLGDDKPKIDLTGFNALNISKENINDILIIFDDNNLKIAIQDTSDHDFIALNDYYDHKTSNIDNIKVILSILLTSYNVKEFIYSHHDKREGDFYILKKLFESEILYSVLISYSE
jgi:hypothetical protein